MMIPQPAYTAFIQLIGRKFVSPNIQWIEWFRQYEYYENMWDNYFRKFLKYHSENEDSKCIEFVFWESCPGGMPFPHQNYVFDLYRYKNLIDGTTDSYLKKVCDKFGIDWKHNNCNKQIGEIINDLIKKKILIIDLYPTHGISLDSTNREKLVEYVLPTYSINKLVDIGKHLTKECKSTTVYVTLELKNAGIDEHKIDVEVLEKIRYALDLKSNPEFQTI